MEKIKDNGTEVSQPNHSSKETGVHEQAKTSHDSKNKDRNFQNTGNSSVKSEGDNQKTGSDFRYFYSGRKLL